MSQTWHEQEIRRARVEQVAENSSRFATASATYSATGVGAAITPDAFNFGMAFLDRPSFSFGASLADPMALPALADLPNVSALVYRWKTNAKGFYTGAWCYFIVQTLSGVNLPTLVTIFDLQWRGVASKNFYESASFPMNTLDIG